LGCLESLVAQRGFSFEVVIVDNASSDETPQLLARVRGARVMRSEANLGFLRACNRAAGVARGTHLLFLNNDTILGTGSVSSALDTLTRQSNVGAVGARLVFPDGSLQEAGSIIWRDGSCLGYGRGDSPWQAAYAFERDVDFCSAAFLLTARRHFEMLGGFDSRYEPAYYEDADYCVRLWKAGLRVVYDPRVVVTHLEFGSAPSAAQAVAQQLERRTIFIDAHRAWLSMQSAPAPRSPRRAARRRGPGLRVLVVDDRVPRRSMGFGFPRAVALLSALVELGHDVTLVPTAAGDDGTWLDTAEIAGRVEVASGGAAGLSNLFCERAGEYDVVLVSRAHNMALLRAKLGSPRGWMRGASVIYDAEAVTAVREVARRRLLGEAVAEDEARRLVGEELALAADVDAVLAVSPTECDGFAAVAPGRVHRVGHAVGSTAPAAATGPAAPLEILFVGAFHELSPNADSVEWFVTWALPLIRARVPRRVAVTIVGPNPPASVLALGASDVHVVGPVDDLAPHYRRARVFVAPTRFAAGIPLKVIEAAAAGVPAVVTPILASQLAWRADEEFLVADEPAAFAEACVRLLCDEPTWARVRAAAQVRAARDHSPAAMRDALAGALDAVAHRQEALVAS
jgi:GT2 family glycosyltransferase/glycosyltransferase involved in cell wall biosynthesis